MTFWILASLCVFLLQTYGTAMIGLARHGVTAYVGPRDALGEPGPLQARASRALSNMRENMLVFLPLALLSVILEAQMMPADLETARRGAALFVLARLPYALVYVWGVPWLRSFVFMLSWIGLGMMAWALI